jgi:cation:H+ antiporter
MLEYILFGIGFLMLLMGADFLVDGSSSLARKWKVSDLIVGLTIVAFGTSMPELVVNIFSSASGHTDIAIGNILGSNIFNIFFILGLSAIIFPLAVTKGAAWKDIPLSFIAALVVWLGANGYFIIKGDKALGFFDGLVFLLFFAFFMWHIIKSSKKHETANTGGIISKEFTLAKSWVLVIFGLALLIIGGKWTVDGAVSLARLFGVSEALIGLTIIAAGTSLPELATSTVAAFKKNADIAVGNIVGSNIFNIFFILGISAVIRPLPFNTAANFDAFATMFASVVLFAAMFVGKKHKIDRWEGVAFLLIYVAYVAYLVWRG